MVCSHSAKIVSGNSNLPLMKKMMEWIHERNINSVDLIAAEIKRFSDGEVWVEIQENVRGQDVFVLQSTSYPANDHLMELLITVDALKRASARRITAVIPYYGYARQDRKTAARTPVSAKLVSNLLRESGVDRVLTLDLHAGQIQAFFDIPCDNMYAAPILCSAIQQTFPNLEKVTIVSPDVGGVVRARNLAKRLGVGIAIVDKRRSQPGVVDNMEIIGDVNGKICLICDDICDTAGTLVKAADCLKEHGSIAVHAYVSHGVLSEPAVERISTSELSSFTMTDSIDASEKIKNSEKIHCLSIAPLFAQAIINVSSDNSLSTLFHEKYVAPLYNSTIA